MPAKHQRRSTSLPLVAHHPLRLVWPVLYILSPVIPLLFFLIGNWYSFLDGWSLAIVFGTTAYIYLLNQFITGVRLKYFDRIYGFDTVLRFHVVMAIIGLLCAVVHHQIFTRIDYVEDNLQIRLGEAAIWLFISVSGAALLFFAGPLVRFRLIRRLRRFVQQRLHIQYQHLRATHNLVAVAMLCALLHALLASVTQEQIGRVVILAGWYAVATTIYIRHKIILPRRRKAQAYTVTKVISNSPDYCTVQLHAPTGTPPQYRPGQFGFVRFVSGTQSREEHPYTFSSAPHNPFLAFTAKKVGDWSSRLPHVKIGDKVAVDAPYGRFSYKIIRSTTSPLIFIACSSGITPFISMLEALMYEKSQRPIRLIWELPPGEQNFYASRLQHATTILPNFHHHNYNEQSVDARNTQLNVLAPSEIQKGHFFICGNPGFYRAIMHQLRTRGISAYALHAEKFEF